MTPLAFIDTETTGLDPRIHQPWEVCVWREDHEKPCTRFVPHDLTHADPQALTISGYWDRRPKMRHATSVVELINLLHGVTLVGSNPAFDAAMLTRYIGTPVWHHRMIDVAQAAMWVLDTGRPIGLAEVRTRLVDLGYDVPEPDHTAEGDVRTTRAAYNALVGIRGGLRPPSRRRPGGFSEGGRVRMFRPDVEVTCATCRELLLTGGDDQ